MEPRKICCQAALYVGLVVLTSLFLTQYTPSFDGESAAVHGLSKTFTAAVAEPEKTHSHQSERGGDFDTISLRQHMRQLNNAWPGPDTGQPQQTKRPAAGQDAARQTDGPDSRTADAVPDVSQPVNCSRIIEGDKAEILKAQAKNEQNKFLFPDNFAMIREAKDCESFVSRRSYPTESLSPEEAAFPLAFTIRMHHKVAQAERLLRTIYQPQNVYCIYIDKKSRASTHYAMKAIADCFPNVFIASRLDDYVYTGFSAVEADLQCMRDLMEVGADWKYLLNMAGTEFPLKTNLEMVRILKALNGSNDIEQYTYPPYYRERISYRYRVEKGRLVNTFVNKEPFTGGNITVRKGCSYNTFSRPFVRWVLTDPLAQSFINWTRDIHSPDEVVWASLNSHPSAPGGYQAMVTQVSKTFLSRSIVWYNHAGYCRSKYFLRGVCILSVEDLGWLLGRWELFANKFDDSFDHVALDCLEFAIKERTAHPDPDHNVKWHGVYRAPHVQTTPPPGVVIR